MMTAVTISDRAHATRSSFRRRVDDALQLIEEASRKGRIGVCFSGGKDSTVLLDLVRRVVPDAPAAFFDSGCEFRWTYELVEHYGVETIKPELALLDGFRLAHDWGYRDPTGRPPERVDYQAFQVHEPAIRFIESRDLQVSALGLSARENRRRLLNIRTRGQLYWQDTDQVWRLLPLAWWSLDDVWAYIASRQLRYNEAYDRMTSIGVSRQQQRVSWVIGYEGARTEGRFAVLRQIDPETFHRLAEEFPNILNYT